MWEKERDTVCMRKRERERKKERGGVWVRVYERKRWFIVDKGKVQHEITKKGLFSIYYIYLNDKANFI